MSSQATAVLGYLISINVIVLLFNLIPGFPLDGGRIARAIAWKITGDRNRATRFAAVLGRGVGWLMVAVRPLLGISGATRSAASGSRFIGFFLTQAARSAEVQADFAGRIEHLRVADVMDAEPVAIPRDLTLDRAEDEYFLRYGWPWFPVVDEAGPPRRRGVPRGRGQRARAERTRRTTGSVMARDDGDSGLRARVEDPLESLLGPGEPRAPGRGDGRGRRRRAARDRHDRARAAGAARRRGCIESRGPTAGWPLRCLTTTYWS